MLFRPIDYLRDPLAQQGAELIFESVLGDPAAYPDAAQIYRTMAAGMQNYCVTSDSGQQPSLLAVGSLKVLGEGVCQAENIAVVPESRGKKVGSFLLGKLEEEAVRAKACLLRVTTLPSAIGFYSCHGYSQISPSDESGLAKLI